MARLRSHAVCVLGWLCLVSGGACRRQDATVDPPPPAPQAPLQVETDYVDDAVGSQTATLARAGVGELGGPRAGLDERAMAEFERGRQAFVRSFRAQEGLGPHYNDTACVACHDQPVVGGGSDMGHAVRVVLAKPVIEGVWPQKSLPGHLPLEVPAGAAVSMHRPPALWGLGLFEAIADEVLRSNCDPRDTDGDGVAGLANVAFDGRPGRFGFKAHNSSLRDFIGNALTMELGLTNPVERDPLQKTDRDALPDPEVSAELVDQLTAYVRALAPPARAGSHPEGQAHFEAVGCVTCHKRDPGPEAPGAYTDLCVHSLGPAFDNGIQDLQAAPDQWRTAPLWGLRFRKAYFHDDRAPTLDAAIRMHGGEASGARDRYMALPEPAQEQLRAFLRTL